MIAAILLVVFAVLVIDDLAHREERVSQRQTARAEQTQEEDSNAEPRR
jgi:cell division protein ZapA (FtsZ GTPase activity inhibitor)